MLELNLPQSLYRQEEQKWLDALEKGELDDFGRVKQDKDVSMMTARQVYSMIPINCKILICAFHALFPLLIGGSAA